MFKIQANIINDIEAHNIEYGKCYIVINKTGNFEVITWKNHDQGYKIFKSLNEAKKFALYCLLIFRKNQ